MKTKKTQLLFKIIQNNSLYILALKQFVGSSHHIFFSIIVSISCFYIKAILILYHHDPQISETATLYMRVSIPGIFLQIWFPAKHLFFEHKQLLHLWFPLSVSLVIYTRVTYSLVHWISTWF